MLHGVTRLMCGGSGNARAQHQVTTVTF